MNWWIGKTRGFFSIWDWPFLSSQFKNSPRGCLKCHYLIFEISFWFLDVSDTQTWSSSTSVKHIELTSTPVELYKLNLQTFRNAIGLPFFSFQVSSVTTKTSSLWLLNCEKSRISWNNQRSAQLLQIGWDQGQVGWHSSWQRRYCNSRRAHGPLRPTWKRAKGDEISWLVFPYQKKKARTIRNLEDSDPLWRDASKSLHLSTSPTSQVGWFHYTFGPFGGKCCRHLDSLATAPLVAASDDSNANRKCHLGCGSEEPAAPRAFLSQLFIAKPQTT